jgi:hypothetical protein
MRGDCSEFLRDGGTVGAGKVAEVNVEPNGFVVGFLEFTLAMREGTEEEVAGIGHDSGALVLLQRGEAEASSDTSKGAIDHEKGS